MRLACSSWSYHAAVRDGRLDLRGWVRLCAEELEVDGIELADAHIATTDAQGLRELKRAITDAGLTLASLAVTNDFGRPERRATEIEAVKRWCDIAAYLGAPMVRVFAGANPQTRPAADVARIVGLIRRVFGDGVPDRRRAWSDATWALRQCADYAAEGGISIALQNSRPGGIVGSAQQLAKCLRDVGSPWLRVCLDPADVAGFAGIDLALPHTVLARARLHDIRDDGSDTSAHWPEIIRMLRLGRYRGFLVLDYDGVEASETAVPRAARHMRWLLHLLTRQELLHPAAAAEPGDVPLAAVEQASAVAVEDAVTR